MKCNAMQAGKRDYTPVFLFTVAFAAILSTIDTAAVSVALPTISEAFSLSATESSLIVSLYLLTLVGSILIIGKLTNCINIKRLFYLGLSLFILSTFFSGCTPETNAGFNLMLLFRAVHGVAIAIIIVASPVLISTYTTTRLNTNIMGMIMAFAAFGLVIGQILGGYLVNLFSWHWAYFLNVPFGVIILTVLLLTAPDDVPATGNMKGFDWMGSILAFIAAGCLIFVTSKGMSYGWDSALIRGAAIAGVTGLVLFIFQERKAAEPLIEWKIFTDRNFVCMSLILFLAIIAYGHAMFMMPYYLEYVGLYDSNVSGLILCAASLGMTGCGFIASIWLSHSENGAWLCRLSAALLVIGFFSMLLFDIYSPLLFVYLVLFVIGCGIGMMLGPITNMMIRTAPRQKRGMMSGIVGLERFTPFMISTAILPLIMTIGVMRVWENPLASSMPIALIPGEYVSQGFFLVFLFMFCVSLILFVLTLFVRDKTVNEA